MTLISLLFVLALERIATQNKYWQADVYFSHYQTLITQRGWLGESDNAWLLAALVTLPALLVFLLLNSMGNNFFSFIISTSVLMVCVGCPALRATYKSYLQAANRGDLQACSLYADQLGHDDSSSATFGQNLVWLNYRHYAAIVLYFVAFGAAGAVAYVLARSFHHFLHEQQHSAAPQADQLMHVLDWLPVRITALGFLLVGHFSRAFPIWLSHFPDPAVDAKTLLADVSRAAEEVESDEHDCTEEPCTLVRLAKRNVMFMLVIISVLTLSGWLS
jgi:AmpE protein